MKTCTTCGHDISNPHRVIINGSIVEGCITADHNGALYGNSLEWHNRPEAKRIRANIAKHLKAILA